MSISVGTTVHADPPKQGVSRLFAP